MERKRGKRVDEVVQRKATMLAKKKEGGRGGKGGISELGEREFCKVILMEKRTLIASKRGRKVANQMERRNNQEK